ncbi:hypothetical protein WICPIJ_008708 [Wickerhamomyces pijperi]|uniref:Uncharacterized protein n=1 Tax=Wickerhamomyces pijperi TaxID=599730 RepID=A0A9P8THR4_WICPI|nr:hypothetical protein WICPIJ_008708 [Wickerhamomyces pijperi]
MSSNTDSPNISAQPNNVSNSTTTSAIPIKSDRYEPHPEQQISQSFAMNDDDMDLATPIGSLNAEYGSFMKRSNVEVNATVEPTIQEDEEEVEDIQIDNGDEAKIPTQEEPETELEKALKLRDKLDALLRRTLRTKQQCERLEQDNKYLQEFVGNLMNSGDYLNRRV